jgi:hypothetical protein
MAAGHDQGGATVAGGDRHGTVTATVLNDHTVARIDQKLAAATGLDATLHRGYGLRAGCAASAAARGIEERSIAP